ncbi:MAG: M48 family metallopeptidase [Clostridiales Family XIII bacterium]|nr:M48 family metallopeptidase [Clostridiales Family XIII bacterium]
MIEYKLVRSNRKTIALHITAKGLEVRAPLFMPAREIERFVKSKENWIDKHLDGAAQNSNPAGRFLPGYGDEVSFRGRKCRIVGSPGMGVSKPGYVKGRYEDGMLLITEGLEQDSIRFVLSCILKREAGKHIPQRVRHCAALMGLRPDGVKITSAFGRWGSCSAKKRLNFAWMLMMADDETIDSVVIHELSHMIHMNHSPDFYKTVRAYCPAYDAQRKKLKELGRQIAREGWKR